PTEFYTLSLHDALPISELQPELIFLDVHLPDMSGLEVCRRLRRQAAPVGTRIVMLTAAAQQDDVARGLSAGATHYLTKPFSPVRDRKSTRLNSSHRTIS